MRSKRKDYTGPKESRGMYQCIHATIITLSGPLVCDNNVVATSASSPEDHIPHSSLMLTVIIMNDEGANTVGKKIYPTILPTIQSYLSA